MPYRDMPKRDMGARITEKEGLEEVELEDSELEEIAGGNSLESLGPVKNNNLFDFNSKFFPTIKE